MRELIDRELTGLFHVTNAGECSWFKYTRELYRQAGVEARLEPIMTEQSQRRARRPAYSVLANIRLREAGLAPMRSWQEALAHYLQKKAVTA